MNPLVDYLTENAYTDLEWSVFQSDLSGWSHLLET